MWTCLCSMMCEASVAFYLNSRSDLIAGATHLRASLKCLASGLWWVESKLCGDYLLEIPIMTSSWDRLPMGMEPAFQGTQAESCEPLSNPVSRDLQHHFYCMILVTTKSLGPRNIQGEMDVLLPASWRWRGRVTLQRSMGDVRFCCNHIWKVNLTKWNIMILIVTNAWKELLFNGFVTTTCPFFYSKAHVLLLY